MNATAQPQSPATAPTNNSYIYADAIVDRLNEGIIVIDHDQRIVAWNRFMTAHTGISQSDALGRKMFDCFTSLPESHLRRQIAAVFKIGTSAFISWEQYPHIFQFEHTRPITSSVEKMFQNLTLLPLKNDSGEVTAICIIVSDVTDTALYHSQLEQAVTRLRNQNRIDDLTQLFNRGHWEERTETCLQQFQRFSTPFSIVLFDLDHFKKINDSYGHPGGDEVLKGVARTLQNSIRNVDVAARWGGEEFSLLLPQTELNGAELFATRLLAAISALSIPYEQQIIHCTCSIGIAQANTSHANLDQLIKAANEALYQAKASGRNCIRSQPAP